MQRFLVCLVALSLVFEAISFTNGTTNSSSTIAPTPALSTSSAPPDPPTNSSSAQPDPPTDSSSAQPDPPTDLASAVISAAATSIVATTATTTTATTTVTTTSIVATATTTAASSTTTTTATTTVTTTSIVATAATTAAATTTTAATPTTSPSTHIFSVNATFNITFKDEYKNKTSPAYTQLKNKFTEVLTNVYNKTAGFLRVEILSFSKGSVVCDFKVIFNGTSSPKANEVKNMLQNASDSGNLGGYTVTKIEIEATVAPTPTPSATVLASTSATQTTSAPPAPTTPSSKKFWDKVILDYLGGTLISFIVMVVVVGLCLILLIALICTCHHYRKLKKKTMFPKDLIINNDSTWINSHDDLLMWERNLRATEVNPGNAPNRPTNEKRL